MSGTQIQMPSLPVSLIPGHPVWPAGGQAGGWGLHAHPTNGRGVGLLGSKGPLLNWGHLGQPTWASLLGGRINTADQIRLRMKQGEGRQGGRVLVETLTRGHMHVWVWQPARLGQPPHHFPDCMETVELVNPSVNL